MKEFKLDVNGIAIPIVNCETQIEFTKAVSSFRYSGGKLGVEAHEDEYVCNIYIIYKDGTCYYHNGVDKDEGKYKRTGIKSGIITDDNSAIVFGSFAINEYGNISIDESDIEEYGVYAGQYDVKEQEVQEAVEQTTEVETSETTAEQETVEGISKMEIPTETGDSGFEYTRSQAQTVIMTATNNARERYRRMHDIHSPMDLKKFSKKQLDDYLSKELDYINKFLNDTLPKEVFNAMKGEIMYA